MDTDDNDVLEKQAISLDSIYAAVKVVEKQNNRILKLQTANYEWHQQHQEVLKKMMKVLMSLDRSKAVNPGKTEVAKSGCFHDQVMHASRSNPDSLKAMLLTITAEQFQELKDSSVEVLIPHLANLVKNTSNHNKRIGMAILWESSQKYPEAFQSAESNNSFYQVVADILQKAMNWDSEIKEDTIFEKCGITFDELNALHRFFLSRL